MNETRALFLGLLLFCTLLLVVGTSLSVSAKSKEEKAIDKALSKVGYKNVCTLGITTKTNNITQQIYNNSKCIPVIPPPPPIVCPNGQHLDNGVCVPDVIPPPPPPPPPVKTTTKVCLVGDLSGSTVPNKMVNCNVKIGLGDLGYASDLKYFKALNFDKCIIGNHDAPEDGSSSIYKEALAYCGDSWTLKVGTALFMGFNTNGNLDTQLGTAQGLVTNATFMQGVKDVFILSHKPCYTTPSSHHPVEKNVKTLCDSLAPYILQSGVKVYYIAAHNHQMASSADGTKFLSGAGGKSFYSCSTDSVWAFCDNSHYGFLELTIDNNSGAVTTKFIS